MTPQFTLGGAGNKQAIFGGPRGRSAVMGGGAPAGAYDTPDFKSYWETATGDSDNAVMDGTTWSDRFGSRAGLIGLGYTPPSVVTAASTGFTWPTVVTNCFLSNSSETSPQEVHGNALFATAAVGEERWHQCALVVNQGLSTMGNASYHPWHIGGSTAAMMVVPQATGNASTFALIVRVNPYNWNRNYELTTDLTQGTAYVIRVRMLRNTSTTYRFVNIEVWDRNQTTMLYDGNDFVDGGTLNTPIEDIVASEGLIANASGAFTGAQVGTNGPLGGSINQPVIYFAGYESGIGTNPGPLEGP